MMSISIKNTDTSPVTVNSTTWAAGQTLTFDFITDADIIAELNKAGTKLVKATPLKAGSSIPVTPNDSAPLPNGPCKSLYIGVAGNLSVILDGQTGATTLTAVPVGEIPLPVTQVKSTGTTATNIVAKY